MRNWILYILATVTLYGICAVGAVADLLGGSRG